MCLTNGRGWETVLCCLFFVYYQSVKDAVTVSPASYLRFYRFRAFLQNTFAEIVVYPVRCRPSQKNFSSPANW